MKGLLIVDDEAFAREAVANTIAWQDHGVQVFQASSGAEALALMEQQEIHLLMTDIRMPAMSGLELIEEVHRRGYDPGIIVLSSYNEFELVRSAMQLGAEDYLFKPTMMPKEIQEAVLRILEKKRKSAVREEPPEARSREYLGRFLQGEKRKPDEKLPASWKEMWDKREVAVITVRLFHYQKCLLQVFEDDLNLLQFSIGNVLGEILGQERGHEVFRMNHKEYAIVTWKMERETGDQAMAEISERLLSGFTFLKLYYGMSAAAGVSSFGQGLEQLGRKHAQSVELCSRADPDVRKILFAREAKGQGAMKREMYQALNFIGENLGNPGLSLSMVADSIGVSKNYFSRIFKESMGVKFVDYVTKQRMEQARNLYLNSDLKIYEIAEKVGYSDWHYLYSLYKKTYGHSLSKEKEKTEEIEKK